MDAKLMVDIATGVMEEFLLLEDFSDRHTQRICERLEAAFKEAALASAAPAQGSIDTPEFKRLLDIYVDDEQARMRTFNQIAQHIDTHIAQRAASGYSTDWKSLYENEKAIIHDTLMPRLRTAEALAQRAASADEVADIFGPQVWSKEAEMRKSWEKIGAPDAPAGDVEPVYQIANDSKPSGWSDVTKEVFDLHLVTTWRKKRILFATPVTAKPNNTCIPK